MMNQSYYKIENLKDKIRNSQQNISRIIYTCTYIYVYIIYVYTKFFFFFYTMIYLLCNVGN